MTNQSKRKHWVKISIGLLIILLGGIWLFRTQQSSVEKVLTVLPRFSISCLVLVVALDSLQIFFMAVRFWFLFPKEHRTSLKNVFAAMAMGQTMNAFLPARAGDIYKVATLTPKPAKPDFGILALTGILTADKLVDTAAFFVLIFATGSYLESSTALNLGKLPSWQWCLGLGLLLFGLWHWVIKKRFQRIRIWVLEFIKGLKSLLSPKQLFLALLFAVLVWLCEAYALQKLGFYQNYSLTLSQTFFILTMLNIAIAVPISIANIGPFEASLAFAMNKLGMPMESALAVATVHHGLQVVAYVLCGSIGWALQKMSSPSDQVAL